MGWRQCFGPGSGAWVPRPVSATRPGESSSSRLIRSQALGRRHAGTADPLEGLLTTEELDALEEAG